jgi:hypothetical protein
MSVAVNKKIKVKPCTGRVAHPVKGSTHLYEGTLYFIDSTGFAVAGVASGANKFGGVLDKEIDNTGSDGDKWTEGLREGAFVFEGTGFAQTSVGKRAYATDNFTVSLTAAGGVDIGEIVRYIDSTHVEVDIEKAAPMVAATGVLGAGSTVVPSIPVSAQQALSGAGAVNVTTFCTKLTTTGANALTLADGVVVGQLKKIQLIVDGGDGTLTPSNLAGGTTIVFADVGDFALLCWNGTDWVAIELGNDADGVTAPVLA